jgi:RNA polymerase sigma-70 factor, ECF subfamily
MDQQQNTQSEEVESPGVETLVQRCLPAVRRWAHGRLPAGTRGRLDTCDVVQEVALRMLSRRGDFTPKHPYAVQAYLCQSVLNFIRDEARRIARRPVRAELPEELPSDDTTPLEFTINQEIRMRYRRALDRLKPKDRALVVARVDCGQRADEIARAFGLATADAARVAVARALRRLALEVASAERRGSERSSQLHASKTAAGSGAA